MSERQRELATKRDALLAESALQRGHLVAIARDIEGRLSDVDRRIEIVRTVAKKPAVIAGAIAVVALIGPRRLLSLAGRGATFLTAGRRVMKMLRR